jgi:hypothetical protein
VQLFYPAFHPGRWLIVENMGRSALTENVLVTKSIFMKLALSRQLFVENLYAEFHENKTGSLVADIASRMNKWIWSAHEAFTFLCIGRLQ